METRPWQPYLKYNPLPALLSCDDRAVLFWANKDLLGQKEDSKVLWTLPLARHIFTKQQPDGSWLYPGGNKKVRSAENYNQIETFRNVGYLVEMFGFNNSSQIISKAANFLFSFQTNEGDIRGILGSQYTPYYTAGMLELLIKAGYENDPRVFKAFEWLKSMRQNDGGWAIPLRTQGRRLDIIAMNEATLQPDKSQPFSHLVTGMVLRAYAAHPTYRNSAVAKKAGVLLTSRLFKKDAYPDRGAPDYWLRFTYPFWFTDLISAADTLSRLGFSKEEPQIQKAIAWFAESQQDNGSWQLKTLKNQKKFNTDLWLSLSICRVIKRFYS